MIKKNFVKILPTLNEIKSLTAYESKFFKKKKKHFNTKQHIEKCQPITVHCIMCSKWNIDFPYIILKKQTLKHDHDSKTFKHSHYPTPTLQKDNQFTK